MAFVFHSGFESGNTLEWSTIVGTPSIQKWIYTQKQETYSDGTAFYTTYWRAQTFTTSLSYTIKGVYIPLYKAASPTTNITVSIKATDGNGQPTGDDLASGTILGGTNIGTTAAWYECVFTSSYTFSANVKYAIVVRTSGGDATNYYRWSYENSDIFAGGNREQSSNSGGSWTAVTTSDNAFRTCESPKTGTYAMRCNTTAAQAYVYNILYPTRATVYLYIAAAPDAECKILGSAEYISLTSDRYLKYYDSGGLRGTGTTQLNLATWYRISISLNDAADSFKVFLDGVEEISGTSTATFIYCVIGVFTTCTTDLYFDDYAGDNVNTGTIDIGDTRTLLSLPNAAGQYADFDTVVPSGATHYITYDDPPGAIDDTDYVQQAGKTAVRDTAGLQDCAIIGIGASDTLQAVNVLNRMKGATDCGISVRDNATDYNYAKPLNKTIAWFSQYFAQAPSGPTAWTQDRFNAFQAGAFHAYNQGTDTFLYALMVMVAYIPAAVEAAWKKLLFTSEPPTPNAWNQLSLDAGTGWKKLNY